MGISVVCHRLSLSTLLNLTFRSVTHITLRKTIVIKTNSVTFLQRLFFLPQTVTFFYDFVYCDFFPTFVQEHQARTMPPYQMSIGLQTLN